MQTRKDVFLSHASEDKAQYVVPLAEELTRRGISYWLDEAEIKWGDRITNKVDEGLALSRYVVVVLSDSFIGKGWPEAELGSALNRENSDGQTTVLPLITTDPESVFRGHPLLRDKVYLHWDRGISYIGDRLGDLLRYTPQQDSIESEGLMTELANESNSSRRGFMSEAICSQPSRFSIDLSASPVLPKTVASALNKRSINRSSAALSSALEYGCCNEPARSVNALRLFMDNLQ